MADVSIVHVDKFFGDVHAVNDVSLDIHDGEFLVLLGPSGCGKTTLLRMIAGLESPTSGEIAIGDRVVNFVHPKDRDIAMVFQNYALYPAHGRRRQHHPRPAPPPHAQDSDQGPARKRRRHGCNSASLLDRTPRQLSGGQQQRVALGRAVVREPKVFLMDEPLSNLDARLRVQMRTELIKLHRRLQATIVYVTHDQSEAMTMASRVAIMRDGVLQQCDAPLEVYRHPANKYVAAFMGNPEMNFMRASIERTGDELVFAGESFRVPVPPSRRAVIEASGVRDVWLGIRPEAITIEPAGEKTGVVTALVDVVSPMGGNTLIFALFGDETVVADVPSDVEPAVGDRVAMRFDPERLHAFDPETERALW